MSFISRFKAPAFAIALCLFVAIEIGLRLAPPTGALPTGVFLTEHRRALAEASTPEFDYIILGASKSLSLLGHPPTSDEPYSIYNFSMPALGSRYFQFFVKKYLKNRKRKPAAVVFAADPAHFQNSWSTPYHDPEFAYSDGLDESLFDYMGKRVVRRIEYALDLRQKPSSAFSKNFETMVWETFSHRYLHLFGFFELAEQFTGAERVFILKEALPVSWYTYRYRDVLKYYTFDFTASHVKEIDVPRECAVCENRMRSECHPKLPRTQDNRQLAEQLNRTYGQINLADRLDPFERLAFLTVRSEQIKKQAGSYEVTYPDLTQLEALIRFVTSQGIKFVISPVPSVEAYRTTRFHREYFSKIKKLVAKYPGAKIIPFSVPYFPEEYFVEQVHYDCAGARRLNDDFYRSVVPGLLRFAPPLQDQRERGFQ